MCHRPTPSFIGNKAEGSGGAIHAAQSEEGQLLLHFKGYVTVDSNAMASQQPYEYCRTSYDSR